MATADFNLANFDLRIRSAYLYEDTEELLFNGELYDIEDSVKLVLMSIDDLDICIENLKAARRRLAQHERTLKRAKDKLNER